MTAPRSPENVGGAWVTRQVRRRKGEHPAGQPPSGNLKEKLLTILLAVPPLGNLGHASPLPKLFSLGCRVLQALFDLDSVVGPDELAQDGRVASGGIKGLVAAPFGVVHILANDLPVVLDKGVLPEDPVGMAEAVQDKPGFVSASPYELNAGVGEAYSWVIPSLSEL